MDYGYESEKLSAARHCLMLPHTQGVEGSIANAFHECTLAFHHMDESGLSDDARTWVANIKELMDTTGLEDPDSEGTWAVKACGLSVDQQLQLSRAVDELAHYFDRKFWGD